MVAPSRFQIRIGGQWKDYGHDEDRILKMLFKQGRKAATITLRGQEYEYDFVALKQRNLFTGRVREIRLPKEWVDGSCGISRAASSRSGESGLSDTALTSPTTDVATPGSDKAAASPSSSKGARPRPEVARMSVSGAARMSPPLPPAPQTTILEGPRSESPPPSEGGSASRVQSSSPGPRSSRAVSLLPEVPHGTIAATQRSAPGERPGLAEVPQGTAPEVPLQASPPAVTQEAPPGEKGQAAPEAAEAPLATLARSIAAGCASWLRIARISPEASPVGAEKGAGPPLDTIRVAPQQDAKPKVEMIMQASSEAPSPLCAVRVLPIRERAGLPATPQKLLPNTTLPLAPAIMQAAHQAAPGEQLCLPEGTVKARVPVACAHWTATGSQPPPGVPLHKPPVETLGAADLVLGEAPRPWLHAN
mmetsp:Transcript_73375/g.215179  ORF Transcript_73375/g.215179 Transcript_73375/m.215179 type:complete len:420 (+) Transcript_73375:62-1321(+)